jgi:hypothetical protein
MPSYPPRADTTKKREQLLKREQEFQHAIRVGFSRERLVRAAENLRATQLSLLKAELYWARDARIRGRDVDERVAKIEGETRKWTEKTFDQILAEVAKPAEMK